MIFTSKQLPGASMNKYGAVFVGSRKASDDEHGLVIREAKAAGCVRVPDTRDTGMVWHNPNPQPQTK